MATIKDNVLELPDRVILERKLKMTYVNLLDAQLNLEFSKIECADIQYHVNSAINIIVERVKTWGA